MRATGQSRNRQRLSLERCEGTTATTACRVTPMPLPGSAMRRPGTGGGHSVAAVNGTSPGRDSVESRAATLYRRQGCHLGAAGNFEWRMCEPRSRMREFRTSPVGGR